MPRKSSTSADSTVAPFNSGNHGRPLSQPEMVLVSLYRASGGTTNKVPYEELVIQAWKDFPEAFSLRNHPEYPDASDIHKKLYQSNKVAGLVVPLGNKMFRLTDKGVTEASALIAALEGRHSPVQDVGRLARSEEKFIQHARNSRALTAWRAGQQDKLVDYDARMFFQFTTGTPLDERLRRLSFAKESISKARQAYSADAEDLVKLAEFLADQFHQLFEGV